MVRVLGIRPWSRFSKLGRAKPNPRSVAVLVPNPRVPRWPKSMPYQPEIKTFDTAITAEQVALAGEVFCLSLIAQSDEYNGRTGRSVQLKSLQFRLVVQPDSDSVVAGGAQGMYLRCIIFVDTNPTAGAENPVVSDILNVNAFALRNPEPGFMTRYKVLMDRWVQVGMTDSDGGAPNFAVIEFYKKLNLRMGFTSTAGTTATMGKNTIWMVIMPTGASDTTTPVINGTARLRYADS